LSPCPVTFHTAILYLADLMSALLFPHS